MSRIRTWAAVAWQLFLLLSCFASAFLSIVARHKGAYAEATYELIWTLLFAWLGGFLSFLSPFSVRDEDGTDGTDSTGASAGSGRIL